MKFRTILAHAGLYLRCAMKLHKFRPREYIEAEKGAVVSREVYCGKCLKGFTTWKKETA